jgi:hypothetical protein
MRSSPVRGGRRVESDERMNRSLIYKIITLVVAVIILLIVCDRRGIRIQPVDRPTVNRTIRT